jgi:hypothetical protein
MRIGVRSKCQRQGIGRKLMAYLFQKYPKHLSLDVSTDNMKAELFYQKCGLELKEKYISEEKVEFAKFETPTNFIPFKNIYTEEKKVECSLKDESASRKQESDEDTILSESDKIEASYQVADSQSTSD